MTRHLPFLLALVAGCGTRATSSDGALLPDSGAPAADLSVPDGGGPSGPSIHDLYATAADLMPVTIGGVVVIGVTRGIGPSRTTMRCEYEAFVGDPGGGPAPSGLRLFATGPQCTPDAAGGCTCPMPPASGTPLDIATTLGDVVAIAGKWHVRIPAPTDAGAAAPEHKVDVTTLTRTGSGGVVAPVTIADGSQFAPYAAGYQQYESMLIAIHPAQRFTIGTPTAKGSFDGAGAHFSGIYRAAYSNGGAFPAAGSTWTAIVGVAHTSRGGGIAPRIAADFIP